MSTKLHLHTSTILEHTRVIAILCTKTVKKHSNIVNVMTCFTFPCADWDPTQPANDNELCAVLNHDANWHDYPCSSNIQAVCELAQGKCQHDLQS